jgi:nitrogenase molybdenum-iron protein NifN
VAGLTGFLAEIGVKPVLYASGGKSGNFKQAITQVTGTMMAEPPEVYEGMDFYEIAERAEELQPDFLIGHSKGYSLARKLNIPLVRVGFPIHDRIGGQRILHLGYGGAQQLFDLIANTIIAEKQNSSPVGYSYM